LEIQDALNALSEANDWSQQLILNAPDHFDPEPTDIPETLTATPVVDSAATATVTQPQNCRAMYQIDTFDTLSNIAVRFGTTVQALAAANNITNPNAIKAGDTLCIPG
jgi:LysM repeat protein